MAGHIKVISWNVKGLLERTKKKHPKTDVGDSDDHGSEEGDVSEYSVEQNSEDDTNSSEDGNSVNNSSEEGYKVHFYNLDDTDEDDGNEEWDAGVYSGQISSYVDDNGSEEGVVGDSVKQSDFDVLMSEENIDIMCLVETLASSDKQFDEVFEGFTVIAKSVQKLAESKQIRNPGGLLFAYKPSQSYTFSKIPNQSDFILWVHADPQKPDVNVQMIFAVVYYPPSGKTTEDEIITIMKREYETLADRYKGAIFYIMGDFNANTHDKADYPDITSFIERKFTSEQSSNIYDLHAKYLLDFCKNTGFRIANGRFGDQSTKLTTKRHVLDYMLCREKDWMYVKSFKVKDKFHGSDHKPIIFTIDTELPVHPYRIVMMEKLKSEPESNDKEHVIFGTERGEEKCNCPELQLPGYNLMKQREKSNVQVYTKEGSLYNVIDLGEEFQQKSGMILNAFSLAPMSAPLLVTDIFCFFLKYSFTEDRAHKFLQTIMDAKDCMRRYPKSRLHLGII